MRKHTTLLMHRTVPKIIYGGGFCVIRLVVHCLGLAECGKPCVKQAPLNCKVGNLLSLKLILFGLFVDRRGDK